MDNIQYESSNEVKNRLHELYNDKIKELESLKIGLEEMKKSEEMQIEHIIRQKDDEKNLEIQKIEKQIKADAERRCAEMEASFECRVQEAANKMIQKYCNDRSLAMEKLKSVLAELENSVLKLIRFQDYEADTEALKYPEADKELQEEEEFKELLKEQDKKLDSITNLINKGMR